MADEAIATTPCGESVIRIFKYLLTEIVPQFFLTLCVISAILVISQLVRITEALANFGLSLENILLPFLFIILPFLSFTIPMAYMFAVVIGFSRLSADGEYPALLACGYSLARAVVPVMLVGTILYGVGALSASYLEPWGRRELLTFYHRKAQTELDNLMKYRLQSGTFLDNFLGFVLYAEDVSKDHSRLQNVLLAPGGQSKGLSQDFSLLAPSASITGSVENGDLKMSFDYGVLYSRRDQEASTVIKFRRADIDMINIFKDQIFSSGEVNDDYRSYPPEDLWHYIDTMESKTTPKDQEDYRKARYLLHQRITVPFGAVVFALFAMVFGIQDQRRGKGGAWVSAILTLIVGYILIMSFKWFAENGHLSAPVAAWTPNVVMTLVGVFVVFQKNRLPMSESALNPSLFPYVGPALQRLRRRKSATAR